MNSLIDIPIIFDDNPISRAYIQLYLSNNLTNKKIIYLSEKSLLPNKIISYFKFHRNNYYALLFLKEKEINYFLDQVQEFFNLEKNFIRDMYKFNNIHKFNKIIYIKNKSINSKELLKLLNTDEEKYYLNTGKQILKEVLSSEKKFIHIHPGFLPEVRGADGSLHSVDKFNYLGTSSFIINKEIDKGPIIYRHKKEYKKFKVKNFDKYNLKDLYRLWFSFVDPLLRASHLKFIIKNKIVYNGKYNEIDTKNEKENYFSFMSPVELNRTFKKIFY
tara:strand:+ start:95 stop:916 length:822 start_codon:yes stop_codon:yes gene_type:complete